MGFFAPLLAVLTLFTTPLALSHRGAMYITPPAYRFPVGAPTLTAAPRIAPRRCGTFAAERAGRWQTTPAASVCRH
ncbi:MAG: hypothetical protein ACXVYV_06340 [Gaiellales bacterium]